MRLLFIGDVFGQTAAEKLVSFLPAFKNSEKIDITIINGENSADGNGITPFSANILLSGGADVITTGNHCFKRREMEAMYNETDIIIRPYNLGDRAVGRGYTILDFLSYKIAVINLIGISYMGSADNPFKEIDTLLSKIDTPNIIVDFHAEATAEKKAMGYFLDGRVSAVLGTHTHVQTADAEILSGGTAYITDTGMTGVHDSVLGVDKKIIIERFLSNYPQKHITAQGDYYVNAVIIDIDTKTGRAGKIEVIRQKI